MTIPAELRYTAEHEWVAVDGPVASVGITDYAQRALGDVVYVSVPAPGTRVTAGEPCGEVESTKSVSDIYSPVDGEAAEGLFAAPPQREADGSHGDQDGRTGGHPHLRAGELLADLTQGVAGDVAGADPLGERVDGMGQGLAGALDLVDHRIRVADRNPAVHLGHGKHPSSLRVLADSLPGLPAIRTPGSGMRQHRAATRPGGGAQWPAASRPAELIRARQASVWPAASRTPVPENAAASSSPLTSPASRSLARSRADSALPVRR